MNDTYGHHIGDLVLRRCASLIAEAVDVSIELDDVSSNDGGHAIVARLGGDEFAVFSPIADPIRAVALCQRIERTLATADWSSLIGDWTQEATVGWAVGRCDDQLLRRADTVLYDRKPRVGAR